MSGNRRPGRRKQSKGAGAGIAVIAIAGVAMIVIAAVMMLRGNNGNSSGSSTGGAQDDAMASQQFPAPTQVAARTTVDPAASGPKIAFGTTAVDFGVVPLSTNVDYAFSYANVGTGKLKINDVSVRVLQGC